MRKFTGVGVTLLRCYCRLLQYESYFPLRIQQSKILPMKLQEFSYYNPVIVFLHPGKKKSTYSFSVFVRGSVLDISLEAYLNKSSKWRVLTHEEQAPTQDQNCWKKKEKPLSEVYMAVFIFRHWKQSYLLLTSWNQTGKRQLPWQNGYNSLLKTVNNLDFAAGSTKTFHILISS